MSSKEEGDDDRTEIVSNPTLNEEDISSVVSDEENEEKDSRSFLKYKHKTKKTFRFSKLNRLQEQITKVENAIMRNQTKKPQVEKKPLEQKQSLSTPSDYIHLFTYQNPQPNLQTGFNVAKELAIENEKKEKERQEQETLFEVFRRSQSKDTTIPIYTLDKNSVPKIINISLSKLNQLNQVYFKNEKSIKSKKKPNIPEIKITMPKKEIPALKQELKIKKTDKKEKSFSLKKTKKPPTKLSPPVSPRSSKTVIKLKIKEVKK